MKIQFLILTFVLINLLFGCRNSSDEVTVPALPNGGKTSAKKPISPVLNMFGARPVFVYGGSLWVGVSADTSKATASGMPVLINTAAPIAVSRLARTSDGKFEALKGAEFFIYDGHKKFCQATFDSIHIISRMHPHFGSIADYGIDLKDSKHVPVFTKIIKDSTHMLAIKLSTTCKLETVKNNLKLWARLKPSTRRGDAVSESAGPQREELIKLLQNGEFNKKLQENSSEKPSYRVRKFSVGKEDFFEVYGKIGEPYCGGTGAQRWILVKKTATGYVKIEDRDVFGRLIDADDYNDDGKVEFLIETDEMIDKRSIFIIENGKLKSIFSLTYPYTDCPC
ncbi:hypothetical protein KKF34_05450 [Myxococcota bacterium]|nr:hypothetical protein [Myxococcota bacterium]MBU1379609.1 hypothetical protein [Myxococcota bacterium]MBU1496306.1 hypothetical protein [Myxococcota bacterium]